MTNAEIIANYKMLNNIPESTMLFTYGAWKNRGYRVRKGERCKHRVPMWEYGEKKLKDNNGDEQTKGVCFTKIMNLFESSQVEKI